MCLFLRNFFLFLISDLINLEYFYSVYHFRIKNVYLRCNYLRPICSWCVMNLLKFRRCNIYLIPFGRSFSFEASNFHFIRCDLEPFQFILSVIKGEVLPTVFYLSSLICLLIDLCVFINLIIVYIQCIRVIVESSYEIVLAFARTFL